MKLKHSKDFNACNTKGFLLPALSLKFHVFYGAHKFSIPDMPGILAQEESACSRIR